MPRRGRQIVKVNESPSALLLHSDSGKSKLKRQIKYPPRLMAFDRQIDSPPGCVRAGGPGVGHFGVVR